MDSIRHMDDSRERHYRQEISRRSPPKDHHDEFMIRVYQGLLSSLIELRRFEGAVDPRLGEAAE